MTRILDLLRREPAALSGIVTALITLGAAFGLQLSGEQTSAITAFVALLSSLIVRLLVTPTSATAAETTSDGTTVAGPASPIPDGTPVDVVPDLEVPQSSDTKADAATYDPPRSDE